MGFQIQEKNIIHEVWVVPTGSWWIEGAVRSDRVSDLIATIHAAADARTLYFPAHLRIVTDKGVPVSRWKVWPGRAKQLLRRS